MSKILLDQASLNIWLRADRVSLAFAFGMEAGRGKRARRDGKLITELSLLIVIPAICAMARRWKRAIVVACQIIGC